MDWNVLKTELKEKKTKKVELKQVKSNQSETMEYYKSTVYDIFRKNRFGC